MLSIITNIGLEHTAALLERYGAEDLSPPRKAGIVQRRAFGAFIGRGSARYNEVIRQANGLQVRRCSTPSGRSSAGSARGEGGVQHFRLRRGATAGSSTVTLRSGGRLPASQHRDGDVPPTSLHEETPSPFRAGPSSRVCATLRQYVAARTLQQVLGEAAPLTLCDTGHSAHEA